MCVNDVQSPIFCRRHKKIGGKADKRPTNHSGVIEMCNLRGTTGVQCALCSIIGTTPGEIKVPKGAVFIRVKQCKDYPMASYSDHRHFLKVVKSYHNPLKGTVSWDSLTKFFCLKHTIWYPNEQIKTVWQVYSFREDFRLLSSRFTCPRSQRLLGYLNFSNI